MTVVEPMTEAAIRGAERPRRFGALYIAEHQVRAMRAYGWTIVVTAVGSPLVYLLGIGLGLAAFIDQPVASGTAGPVDYVWFVAPALLAAAAVGVALDEFTYVVMAGFKWRRIFWGMNASPVSPEQICTGLILSVGARILFTTTAYYALMLAFGAVGNPWAGLAMPFVGLLAGLAFGLPLLAYSASLKDDGGQFAVVQRFIFTPLFLFSGTFYPLDSVPAWLQWIGWVSPLWHASELGRDLSYGTSGGWPWWTHLAVLLVMAGVGWVLARRTFVGRLRG
ncbi:ABC transporter permease [Cellulomonas rhizosphaerae]|uniref:Transport permease protein n=1 Tax=Cellulomonas rhizosphaerae TaxID=2293719 RepID=A0A413RH83_9CELL|nr:ABC transporter permease [Cellulomonas rhizosphaerae]RHA37157.1 ABC transporter permease [Cellulomonas rhizosphaerae]